MVLNGYDYREKSFKKVNLNNSFLQIETKFQKIGFINRKKKQRENIYPQKKIMKKKVLEGIKADVALSGALADTGVKY